jgi:hypothetical protein
MSGESVALIGVAAGVGAMALFGMAAGAGCAYAVGHGLSALGDHLVRREAQRYAARDEAARWDRMLHSVALRNARIGVLESGLAAAGPGGSVPPVTLPPPLVLAQQTLAELQRWCEETDAALDAAEGDVIERSAQAILQRAAELAGTDDFSLDHGSPDDEPTAETAPRKPRPGEAMLQDINRVAGRLGAGTTADERESVARAAQRVLAARSRTDALNRLDDMRIRVDQAREAAAGRRSAAIEAARLLQPLAHAAESAQPVRAQLLQVIAGAQPLTPVLRQAAHEAAVQVQQAADRMYVRRSVTEVLAELGYRIDEGFQTAVVKDGILHVNRSEWHSHGVRMFLDDEKQELRAVVVRTQAGDSWDAARVDAEREAQWCDAQRRLKDLLAAKDISYKVRSLTEPGAKPVPVVSGARSGGTTRAPSAARHSDRT